MLSSLQAILAKYRANSQTELEKSTYFEELIRTYFRYEASYADLYSEVRLYICALPPASLRTRSGRPASAMEVSHGQAWPSNAGNAIVLKVCRWPLSANWSSRFEIRPK